MVIRKVFATVPQNILVENSSLLEFSPLFLSFYGKHMIQFYYINRRWDGTCGFKTDFAVISTKDGIDESESKVKTSAKHSLN